METKKIIQIAVIVVAFGGSGVVLYNEFFKQNAPTAVNQVSITTQRGGSGASGGEILPKGGVLDFSVVANNRFHFGSVQYEQVNTSTEVGVPVSSLIQQEGGPQPAGQ